MSTPPSAEITIRPSFSLRADAKAYIRLHGKRRFLARMLRGRCRENVEIVRRAYSGGDLNALAIEILHPEVELLGAIGGMEEGTVTPDARR